MRILRDVTVAFVLVAALAAPGGVAARPDQSGAPASPPAGTLTIVALGDSLTSGHRLPREQAYPALLEARLAAAGLPFTVRNYGLDGDTTGGALRRLDAALTEDPCILIVALGANDGLRGVPVAQVRANLDRIIERAKARGVLVLLVGMEALPLYGWEYTLDFHNMFPELAARHDVPLVPFMLEGVFGNPDLMSSDGLHPNAAGVQVIAENIWPYLEPLAAELAAADPARRRADGPPKQSATQP